MYRELIFWTRRRTGEPSRGRWRLPLRRRRMKQDLYTKAADGVSPRESKVKCSVSKGFRYFLTLFINFQSFIIIILLLLFIFFPLTTLFIFLVKFRLPLRCSQRGTSKQIAIPLQFKEFCPTEKKKIIMKYKTI